MSDSDCSNCDIIDCKFYDYSYDCYFKQIKTIQQCMDSYDIDLFKKIKNRCEILEKQTDNSNFQQIIHYCNSVIDLYNGE